MKNSFRVWAAAAAIALLPVRSAAQTSAQVLAVDALAGVDAVGAPLLRSIRFAVFVHTTAPPGTTTRILVRGRRDGAGNVVFHDDTVEQWGTNGNIIVPDRVRIEWDAANSDPFLGGPTPAVVTGRTLVPGTGTAAFEFSATAPCARVHTQILGLQIVAFDFGVLWRPASGSAAPVGVTLSGLRFNQCLFGFAVYPPPNSAVIADPLVSACRFENTPQPVTVGGDRLIGLMNLNHHVSFLVAGTGFIDGDIANCTFTADAVAPTGQPVFVDTGIFLELHDGGTIVTTIAENEFLGNGTITPAALHGMLHGVFMDADGPVTADWLVRNCWFEGCGFDGAKLIARRQGTVATSPEGPWNYDPPEASFLHPIIRRSSFVGNGFVAPFASPILQDIGHGVATRSYDFGQMEPIIELCNGTGTSFGHTNVGITANAFDGVWARSEWFMPEAPTFYVPGVMSFTRNDTWLRTSRLYANERHGVSIILREGSGNPGMQENRIYNNRINGIDMDVRGTIIYGDRRDVVSGKPSPWNNFVYNLNSGFATFQDRGINARVRQQTYWIGGPPDVWPTIGVYHNSVTNHSIAGISVLGFLGAGLPTEGVWGNISYLNAGGTNDITSIVTVTNNWTSTSGNPLFQNASVGNLHIANTSLCIDVIPTSPPISAPLIDDIDGVVHADGTNMRPFDWPGIGPINQAYWDIGADEVH